MAGPEIWRHISVVPIIIGKTESGAALYVPDTPPPHPPEQCRGIPNLRGMQQTGVSGLLSIKFTVGDCGGETAQR